VGIHSQENVKKTREIKNFKAYNLLVVARILGIEFFVRKGEHRGQGGREI